MTSISRIRFIRFLCICVLLCGAMLQSPGQYRDSLLNVYNNQTIHSYGNVFIKGSRQFKFRELKDELSSPLTKRLYIESRADLRRTTLLSVTAVAALAGSIILRKKSSFAATSLSIVAIGLNLGAIKFRKRSSEIIDQALWHRNKEILFNLVE